jgi:hypothetical protein
LCGSEAVLLFSCALVLATPLRPEVAGGPSQLVRSDRLFGLLAGRSLRFAKR